MKHQALLLSLLLLGACQKTAPESERETPVHSTPTPTPYRFSSEEELTRRGQVEHPSELPFLRRHLHAPPPLRSWAAFWLTPFCTPHTPDLEAELLASLALWSLDSSPSPDELDRLATALGSCGSERAEAALSAWVDEPPLPQLSRAAAGGLATLAQKTGKLTERTQISLLDAAERDGDPRLLLPFSRLRPLSHSAHQERLLDVAGAFLTESSSPERIYALLALGGVGPSAALPLRQIVLQSPFSLPERLAALQTIARWGSAAQRHLDLLLLEFLERGLPSHPHSETWPLLQALVSLVEAPHRSGPALHIIPQAPLPPPSSPENRAQRHRLIRLRCFAAELHHADPLSPTLLDCDPDGGLLLPQAQLRLLQKRPVWSAKERALFHELTQHPHPDIRAASLWLLPTHPKESAPEELLQRALRDPAAPVPLTVWRLLAQHPRLILPSDPEHPLDEVWLTALQQALKSPQPAVLGAVGALGLREFQPLLEELCEGPHAFLHAPAARALALLGDAPRSCPSIPQLPSPAAAPQPLDPSALLFHYQSALGPLQIQLSPQLDPALLPLLRAALELPDEHTLAVEPGAEGLRLQSSAPQKLPPLPPFRPGPPSSHLLQVGLFPSSWNEGASPLFLAFWPPATLSSSAVFVGQAEGPWHLLVPGDQLSLMRP